MRGEGRRPRPAEPAPSSLRRSPLALTPGQMGHPSEGTAKRHLCSCHSAQFAKVVSVIQ